MLYMFKYYYYVHMTSPNRVSCPLLSAPCSEAYSWRLRDFLLRFVFLQDLVNTNSFLEAVSEMGNVEYISLYERSQF